MIDIDKLKSFLDENGIQHCSTGNHHCRSGWLQLNCPDCGDNDFHLGINLTYGYGYCYRCGYKDFSRVLARLMGVGYTNAQLAIKRLKNGVSAENTANAPTTAKLPFVLPKNEKGFLQQAYDYLKTRFYGCTDKIIRDYKLESTSAVYGFKTRDKQNNEYISYKYASSIVIPNFINNVPVSFQCRSYLDGKHYITAAPHEERVHHKDFLWGCDKVPFDTIVVCEAAFDAMTIGAGAVHTTGCSFTDSQLSAMAEYRKVYIAYDMDSAGRMAAHKLAGRLGHLTDVAIIRFGNGKAKDINDLLKTKDGVMELLNIRDLVQS